MEIHQQQWPVERLVREQTNINLNPAWQRGPAWKPPRQVLLIDSILRRMDIPKIYLRVLEDAPPYTYEAVDGQQRLRAIFEFKMDQFPLTHPEVLPPIDGHDVADLSYSQLDPILQRRFDGFEVTITEVKEASRDEITNLFSRLQMGVSLNPAELRNAMIGPMRHAIDAVATSHRFFLNGRIPDDRYKRQDYTSHAFAMAAYRGEIDVKAPNLRAMISDYTVDRSIDILEIAAKVGEALEILADVDNLLTRKITQKWIFVDLCWLIMEGFKTSKSVNPIKLAKAFKYFEDKRRNHNTNPEVLLELGRPNAALDRQLYNYIKAFRSQGGLVTSINTRAKALRAFCQNIYNTEV